MQHTIREGHTRNRYERKQFDVVVIGGGPGGYIAAIRAAQLGFKVACIDEWTNAKGGPALGGTCTNVGCIPSKALLQSSEHFEHAGHAFAEHGIDVAGLSLNLRPDAQAQGQRRQAQQRRHPVYLFKKNKVTFFHGRGTLRRQGRRRRLHHQRHRARPPTRITAKNVIVATGSNARALPGAPFDEKLILSNTGALAIDAVPAKLGVIGAGVIGLEMGSACGAAWAPKVTVLEGLPTFLGAVDEQIAKEAHKLFTKQGLEITWA